MEKLTDKTYLTFKDLLSRFEFEDICHTFVSLWKAGSPDKAKHLDLKGWKEIYNRCREIEQKFIAEQIQSNLKTMSCTLDNSI